MRAGSASPTSPLRPLPRTAASSHGNTRRSAMSAQSNAPEGPGFTDRLGQRLRWAVIASVLINMGIWRAAAAIARRPAHFTPRPVEITRVILDKKGHKTPKVVTKKQVQKKVAHIKRIVHRPPPRPRTVVHVVRRTRPVPARRPPQG